MQALSTSELLSIWEWGLARSAVRLVLMLLASAYPECKPESLARLSVGQRDSLLFTLRESVFGQRMISLVKCPVCGEELEFDFISSDICVRYEESRQEMQYISDSGFDVQFRLPNSLDLAAIDRIEDLAVAEKLLLSYCLRSSKKDGEEIPVDQLPDEIVDAIAEQMARSDPSGDIQMAIVCASCGHEWMQIFDIVSFFRHEIDTWARRVLLEVHLLASAYGWKEADILAMSPNRRQIYLEMSCV
jgi:hypothetical protein